ncbi:MAG: hypothetical protein ACTSQI_07805 [Candidatus Helarchaeota archaeon]
MPRGEHLRKYAPHSPKKAVLSFRIDDHDKEKFYELNPNPPAWLRAKIKQYIHEHYLRDKSGRP